MPHSFAEAAGLYDEVLALGCKYMQTVVGDGLKTEAAQFCKQDCESGLHPSLLPLLISLLTKA